MIAILGVIVMMIGFSSGSNAMAWIGLALQAVYWIVLMSEGLAPSAKYQDKSINTKWKG